mmetsp:Transcript_16117/g.62854  ORF Transcript_16117/g.62854 Transcript_16117/m.62854 type:complete len:512 (-) Transcript_16117:735-2270(-)
MLHQLAVEAALHVSVRSQRGNDVARPAVLRAQLHWLIVLHVVSVEEHEADDGLLLDDLERVSREGDALDDEAVGVNGEERAAAHEGQACGRGGRGSRRFELLEDEQLAGRHRDRAEDGGAREGVQVEEALELVLAAVVRILGKERVGEETAEAIAEEELLPVGDGLVVALVPLDSKVHDRRLLLVAEERNCHDDAPRRLCHHLPWHIADTESDKGSDVDTLLCVGEHPLLRALEVAELYDPGVVARKVLLHVPGRGTEALQLAIAPEPLARWLVKRSVHLVGEEDILLLLLSATLLLQLELLHELRHVHEVHVHYPPLNHLLFLPRHSLLQLVVVHRLCVLHLHLCCGTASQLVGGSLVQAEVLLLEVLLHDPAGLVGGHAVRHSPDRRQPPGGLLLLLEDVLFSLERVERHVGPEVGLFGRVCSLEHRLRLLLLHGLLGAPPLLHWARVRVSDDRVDGKVTVARHVHQLVGSDACTAHIARDREERLARGGVLLVLHRQLRQHESAGESA